MGLCQCILISCFKLHSIALKLDHRRHWIYLYEKNARQQALPCLVLKIQTKICRRTKYALTTTSLTRTLKRGFLNQLCGKIMRLDFETNLVNILVYSFTFFLDTNYFYQHQLLRVLENQNVFICLLFPFFSPSSSRLFWDLREFREKDNLQTIEQLIHFRYLFLKMLLILVYSLSEQGRARKYCPETTCYMHLPVYLQIIKVENIKVELSASKKLFFTSIKAFQK